jgi:hypothetical protein
MIDPIKLEHGIKKIRSIRVIVFGMFIGALPLWFCLLILTDLTKLHLMYLLIPYGLILLLFGFYMGMVRCPCCNEYFFWNLTRNYRNPFTTRCLTCGLRLNDTQCP